MGVTWANFQVYYYKYLGNYTWDTAIDITKYVADKGFKITYGIKNKGNQFELNLINPQKILTTDGTIKKGSRIKIFYTTEQASSSVPLFDGIVEAVDIKEQESALSVKLSGGLFFNSIFKALVAISFTTPADPVDATLQVIKEINRLRVGAPPGFELHPLDRSEWQAIGNPVVDSNGNAFPTKKWFYKWELADVILTKIWSTENTKDGDYNWWIEYDPVNDQWNLRVGGFVYLNKQINDYQDTIQVNVRPPTEPPVNIYFAVLGEDAYGNPIHELIADWASVAEYGPQMRATTEYAHLASVVFGEEFLANNSQFDKDAKGNPKSMFPNSYPYTFVTDYKSPARTANTDDEFNDLFRDIVKYIGRQAISQIIRLRAKTKFDFSLTYPIEKDPGFGINDVLDVYISNYFNQTFKMRVVKKTISFGTVTYEFEVV